LVEVEVLMIDGLRKAETYEFGFLHWIQKPSNYFLTWPHRGCTPRPVLDNDFHCKPSHHENKLILCCSLVLIHDAGRVGIAHMRGRPVEGRQDRIDRTAKHPLTVRDQLFLRGQRSRVLVNNCIWMGLAWYNSGELLT
jgi:hypothetical protein